MSLFQSRKLKALDLSRSDFTLPQSSTYQKKGDDASLVVREDTLQELQRIVDSLDEGMKDNLHPIVLEAKDISSDCSLIAEGIGAVCAFEVRDRFALTADEVRPESLVSVLVTVDPERKLSLPYLIPHERNDKLGERVTKIFYERFSKRTQIDPKSVIEGRLSKNQELLNRRALLVLGGVFGSAGVAAGFFGFGPLCEYIARNSAEKSIIRLENIEKTLSLINDRELSLTDAGFYRDIYYSDLIFLRNLITFQPDELDARRTELAHRAFNAFSKIYELDRWNVYGESGTKVTTEANYREIVVDIIRETQDPEILEKATVLKGKI